MGILALSSGETELAAVVRAATEGGGLQSQCRERSLNRAPFGPPEWPRAQREAPAY